MRRTARGCSARRSAWPCPSCTPGASCPPTDTPSPGPRAAQPPPSASTKCSRAGRRAVVGMALLAGVLAKTHCGCLGMQPAAEHTKHVCGLLRRRTKVLRLCDAIRPPPQDHGKRRTTPDAQRLAQRLATARAGVVGLAGAALQTTGRRQPKPSPAQAAATGADRGGRRAAGPQGHRSQSVAASTSEGPVVRARAPPCIINRRPGPPLRFSS